MSSPCRWRPPQAICAHFVNSRRPNRSAGAWNGILVSDLKGQSAVSLVAQTDPQTPGMASLDLSPPLIVPKMFSVWPRLDALPPTPYAGRIDEKSGPGNGLGRSYGRIRALKLADARQFVFHCRRPACVRSAVAPVAGRTRTQKGFSQSGDAERFGPGLQPDLQGRHFPAPSAGSTSEDLRTAACSLRHQAPPRPRPPRRPGRPCCGLLPLNRSVTSAVCSLSFSFGSDLVVPRLSKMPSSRTRFRNRSG